ncbi:MAG TPA: PDZ domain-containing protein [Candidatus Nanoarchaeia archaeon]|nr:PDZ domain-containing protein [Candidatus Nanoarchaeia archaeon]
MSKLKEILTSWRVLVLILFLIGSLVAVNPKFGESDGVEISSVLGNTSAEVNGLQPGFIITAVNGNPVKDVAGYDSAVSSVKSGDLVRLSTDNGDYSFLAEEQNNVTVLGVEVKEVPKSNLRQGLDLVGGVRVLLKPAEDVTVQQMSDIIDITQKRLNAFGLSDISVRQINDLRGNRFLQVEIAGTTEQQAVKLVAQQGKFEAKIGNDTVFVGGEDIKQVCRSADCAFVQSCNPNADNEWSCQYQFRVDVSPESARKHSEITSQLGTVNVNGNIYLEKQLDLYLDDILVESLYISESLKGIDATSFIIQGPGVGATEELALQDALAGMKEMQTVLITGALPVKLEIVKTDVISPTLGEHFLSTALLAIFGAIAAVGIIIFARYRNVKIASAVLLTGLSEVFIIFGVAALIKWNLDLAAIAAIIATVGTGVDAQIVIADETISGEKAQRGWKERMKRAFFVIFGSYATVIAAMLPLWALGSTMLKGFAIITILGVSIGVFVTRPAFAKMMEAMMK